MSQVETNPNFMVKYAPGVLRAVQIMMLAVTVFLMANFVLAFPVSITIFFLALPALIMNIGWLMFARAV